MRVLYDDIGAQDGIVVEKSVGFGSEARVFFVNGSLDIVEGSQIKRAGNYLTASDTGLNI